MFIIRPKFVVDYKSNISHRNCRKETLIFGKVKEIKAHDPIKNKCLYILGLQFEYLLFKLIWYRNSKIYKRKSFSKN